MYLKWLKKLLNTRATALFLLQHSTCSPALCLPVCSWDLWCELHPAFRENNLQVTSVNHNSPQSRMGLLGCAGMDGAQESTLGWAQPHKSVLFPTLLIQTNSCCSHGLTGGKAEGAGSSGEALLNSKRAGKGLGQDQSPPSRVPHPPNPALRQHPRYVHQPRGDIDISIKEKSIFICICI